MSTNDFPGIGYTNFGHDNNYFKIFTVNYPTFGGQSVDGYQPVGICRFSTQYVIFTIEGTGSDVVEGSFNGTTVHFKLQASDTGYKQILMPFRVVSKFWLRLASGSSATVSVQAW